MTRNRSYKVQTSAAFLLACLAVAPFAMADKKDDLYAKGQKALADADSIAARDAFCAVAKEDPEYKDAKAQCATYTAAAAKTLNRYTANFGEGQAALARGDFDTAELKFKNVKAGDYAEQAKQKLLDIPRLRQEKANSEAAGAVEAQMKIKLDQGVDAYKRGDFPSAKGLLMGVTGSHKNEAQPYLTNINNFDTKMAEAVQAAASHNYAAAQAAYSEAARIASNGPGDPLGMALKMSTEAAKAAATPTITASNPTPVVNKPPAPVKTIDVAHYLAEGQKALAKNDFKKARRYFLEVFGQDKNNQEANDGLKEIAAKDTAQAVASDEDPLISTLIDSFYKGSFDEVEFRLNDYIYNKRGKKLGLANFYVGASLLTRYYLSGATDDNLRKQAREKFRAAKGIDGFKAPEKFVSPKIMKVFETS